MIGFLARKEIELVADYVTLIKQITQNGMIYWTNVEERTKIAVRMSQRLEWLLDTYRHPNGRKWSGREIYDATGGVVTRSYLSALRNDHIDNPGIEKLVAIADAVGFPRELWVRESPEETDDRRTPRVGGESIAQRLDHLLTIFTDERTKEPHTYAEIARRSLGELSEEEVEAIHSGILPNPSVNQVISLSQVFGVSPSYFLERRVQPDAIDPLLTKVLADGKTRNIATKSMTLPEQDQDMILALIDRLGVD